jgi:hypothetical protein
MRTGFWLAACLGAAACSNVTALDAPRRPLSPGEPPTVREKSDEALAAKQYAVAWNHEFHAGGDRARLEAIFLAALADDAGAAEDMMEQLRAAHGGLSEGATARAKEVAAAEEGRGDWERAAEVLVLVASDAPAFEAAWDVYRRAPPKDALTVLETIQQARVEHEQAAGKRGP